MPYSLAQTADSGYAFGGDSTQFLPRPQALSIVPSLTKTGANGNLAWEHDYYRISPISGLSLTENFDQTALAADGGFLGVAPTEIYRAQRDDLFLVKTDSTGLTGGPCPDIHRPLPLKAVAAQLPPVSLSLKFQAPSAPAAVTAPVRATPTSIATVTDC